MSESDKWRKVTHPRVPRLEFWELMDSADWEIWVMRKVCAVIGHDPIQEPDEIPPNRRSTKCERCYARLYVSRSRT